MWWSTHLFPKKNPLHCGIMWQSLWKISAADQSVHFCFVRKSFFTVCLCKLFTAHLRRNYVYCIAKGCYSSRHTYFFLWGKAQLIIPCFYDIFNKIVWKRERFLFVEVGRCKNWSFPTKFESFRYILVHISVLH